MSQSPTSIALVLLACCAAPAPARADTWVEPGNRKVPSADRKYTALVLPQKVGGPKAREEGKPVAHVYKGEPGEGGKWSTLWKVKLTNEIAPVDVLLSKDGRLLVTLDDWHAVGRTENVVAFYAAPEGGKEGRQVARYRLDQIMTPDEQRKVNMSVSSTWWREGGDAFLDESDAGTFLCVWLEVAGRWAVWDAKTGKAVEVEKADPAARRRWDETRARRNTPVGVAPRDYQSSVPRQARVSSSTDTCTPS